MASIKQSLKKVYKALSGGTDSSSKSISGIIDDISTVASSGGGGGSNDYIVNFSPNPEQGGLISDKTLKQIVDALKEGKNVVGLTNSSAGGNFALGKFYFVSATYIESTQKYSVSFYSVSTMDGQITVLQSSGFGSTNTWTPVAN